MSEVKWDTIAGVDLGYTPHDVVCVNLETNERRVSRIPANRVYVQKCVKEEMSGGIVLTEKSRSDTVCALVLAVGENCGKYRKISKAEKEVLNVCHHPVLGIKPGDIVLCPDDDPMITRSPWRNDDIFIDERVIYAVVDKED